MAAAPRLYKFWIHDPLQSLPYPFASFPGLCGMNKCLCPCLLRMGKQHIGILPFNHSALFQNHSLPAEHFQSGHIMRYKQDTGRVVLFLQ